MTSLQLLKNISNIDSQWLVDMETQKAPAPKPRYSLLVAVICLLALLLAGCGIAYLLHLGQLTIGTQTVPLPPETAQDSQTPGQAELTVFSLQGVKGTPNYQASQEWLAFTQSYTPSGGEYWDSDPIYWAYSLQDQTMVDKLESTAISFFPCWG